MHYRITFLVTDNDDYSYSWAECSTLEQAFAYLEEVHNSDFYDHCYAEVVWN